MYESVAEDPNTAWLIEQTSLAGNSNHSNTAASSSNSSSSESNSNKGLELNFSMPRFVVCLLSSNKHGGKTEQRQEKRHETISHQDDDVREEEGIFDFAISDVKFNLKLKGQDVHSPLWAFEFLLGSIELIDLSPHNQDQVRAQMIGPCKKSNNASSLVSSSSLSSHPHHQYNINNNNALGRSSTNVNSNNMFTKSLIEVSCRSDLVKSAHHPHQAARERIKVIVEIQPVEASLSLNLIHRMITHLEPREVDTNFKQFIYFVFIYFVGSSYDF